MKFILSLLAVLTLMTAPTISIINNGINFKVTFDKGAVGACTIFEDQRVLAKDDPLRTHFPDGHYAPRHCWGLDDDSTGYVDDWDFIEPDKTTWKIWVEVQYPAPGGTTFEPNYREERSNTVEVVR